MAEYGGKKYGDNGVKITTAFSLNNMPLDFRSVCSNSTKTSLLSDCYPGLISYNLDNNTLYYAKYVSTANDNNGGYEWEVLGSNANHYTPSSEDSSKTFEVSNPESLDLVRK